MPTAPVSGNLASLSIEGDALAENRNFNLTLNQAIIDTTNRDTSWWQTSLAGVRDWEISGDGLYIFDDLAYRKLLYHFTNRSPATLTCILTLADGAITVTGECILTSLTEAMPHDAEGTMSFTLKGTGVLTPSAS